MTLSELFHEEARLLAKRKALVMPVEDLDWKPEGGPCPGNILVTGGAGYIGSHTTLQLLVEGYSVVVVDNLNNSCEEALRRVSVLAGANGANLSFFKVDLCNKSDLSRVFQTNKFDAVIHFAGFKAVGESVRNPLLYYQNNINSTLNLVELMAQHNCKKIVFSSSATVYGQPSNVPCTEDSQVQTLNPYARTKLFIEEILRDLQTSDPEWRVILLRYFNPVGAHPSGLIGEDPIGVPNNLMPFIQQVAVGRRPHLTVFGSDYDTSDGTGVRDYIHVMDVATGHTAALTRMFSTPDTGVAVYNLGNGKGTSVLEMVAAFERASHVKIPLMFADRRPGDASEIYASTERASKELLWRGKYTIDDMCRDQWKWASSNPYGYQTPNETVPPECETGEEEEHSNETRDLPAHDQSKPSKALKFMSPSLPIPSDLTPLMNITTNGLIRLEA